MKEATISPEARMLKGIIRGAVEAGLDPQQLGQALLNVNPEYADLWGQAVRVQNAKDLLNKAGRSLVGETTFSGILDRPRG